MVYITDRPCLCRSVSPLATRLSNVFDSQRRPAATSGEVRAGPEVPAPQVPAHVRVVLLAQQAGGDALEGVDQLGELDFRRVVHEQVYVVLFAVELLEVGFEVRADLSHDLFAARQHLVRECLAPVLGDEDQMSVQVVDDVTARAYVRVWIPAW